jgi:hypothetical protein
MTAQRLFQFFSNRFRIGSRQARRKDCSVRVHRSGFNRAVMSFNDFAGDEKSETEAG